MCLPETHKAALVVGFEVPAAAITYLLVTYNYFSFLRPSLELSPKPL